mmetsp:Transcript_7302/g.22114  ORF Transcript_7302/g.22114 Transcript_7302/m.22114 type:complete len:229 (+) Transcript_7302:1307-1993(+)
MELLGTLPTSNWLRVLTCNDYSTNSLCTVDAHPNDALVSHPLSSSSFSSILARASARARNPDPLSLPLLVVVAAAAADTLLLCLSSIFPLLSPFVRCVDNVVLATCLERGTMGRFTFVFDGSFTTNAPISLAFRSFRLNNSLCFRSLARISSLITTSSSSFSSSFFFLSSSSLKSNVSSITARHSGHSCVGFALAFLSSSEPLGQFNSSISLSHSFFLHACHRLKHSR